MVTRTRHDRRCALDQTPRSVVAWLLDSDPALQWQVERDLLRAPDEVWRATRSRVSTEGFGARLLALQDADGQWDGGAYFPGDFDFDGPEAQKGAGQPWTTTTWSLNALREWGVNGSVLAGTADLLAFNSRWEYDDLPYWGGEVDCCINGDTIANGAWLGADVSELVSWFSAHRMDDGGWNCEWVNGSTRSSFHSTLNSLKGLLSYQLFSGDSTRDLRRGGEEYLLERGLYRRLSNGKAVAPWVFRFAYPFRWQYSILNAADYFRMASVIDGTPPDPRMADAVQAIESQRRAGGIWIQAHRHPGRAWFEVDAPAGEPSKWLTLIGWRVLDWWDSSGVVSTRDLA